MIDEFEFEFDIPVVINLTSDEWDALDDEDDPCVSDWVDERESTDELERTYGNVWDGQ